MKRLYLLPLLFLLLIFIDPIYGVRFVSFDYKNEYLEPGKTYDLWVVVVPGEEINDTVLSISPYGAGKEYIQVIKGVDYEGQLLQSEKGVGHFIIHIREDAPSRDYKVVVYCNYTKDGKRHSDNRIFEIPVRGKPVLTLEHPPIIEEGLRTIYIKIKNVGTGTAQDVKMKFEVGNNIYALSEGYVKYIKPGETEIVEIKVYGKGTGIAKLPYTLTYRTPYNNLQQDQKTVEEKGHLIFTVIPSNTIEIYVKNYTLSLGEVSNFTISIKNNYRDDNFTVIVGRYYVGDNQRTLSINCGEVKDITFNIKVDEEGVKNIPVKIISSSYEIERNVSVNVVSEEIPPNAIEIYVKNYTLSLGEVSNFTISIKNNYRDDNFTVIVGRYYVGDNQRTLSINCGEVKDITFNIKVDEEGVKNIPVKIISSGYEIERNVSVNVVGKVDLVLTGINVEGIEKKIITGDISNIGTGKARGVLISIKKTENVIPLKPYENYFIGTLNPDDYGSFELHVKVINGTKVIPVVIQYRDGNNRLIEIEKNISIEGISIHSYRSKKEGSYIPLIIGALFALGVLILLYRIFSRR